MTVSIERSTDYAALTSIARHPAIYGSMADDYSPAPDDYHVPNGEHLIYLLAQLDGVPRGFWLFAPQNHVCFEVHTVLNPQLFGTRALDAAKMAENWIWSNTTCRRMFTNVPVTNRLALRFAKAAGMVEFGINENSYLKNGKLIDQIMLGMSKPGDNQ